MTDREVMQQALEALEGWENCDKWVWPETALEQSKRNTTESLAALRTALEQQQAEPVVWGVDWGHNGDRSCVAIIKKHHNGTMEVIATEYDTKASAPPQRQWVGLTDEEVLKFQDIVPNTLSYDLIEFAKAIEAKLKERNT